MAATCPTSSFTPRTSPAPCAPCCVWSRIGAVVYGVSQEDIALLPQAVRKTTSGELVSSPAGSCSRRQLPHSRHRRFSPKRMPKTVHLRDRASVTDANWIPNSYCTQCPAPAEEIFESNVVCGIAFLVDRWYSGLDRYRLFYRSTVFILYSL